LAEIEVTIFGDGPYKAVLLDLVRSIISVLILDLWEVRLIYLSYIVNTIICLPSHMECFSLSILESLSANVPVITTNVGGNEG
jgi:glycosyltransferase involved in cell wall biosynthesis